MHHLETVEKAGRMKRYKVASSRLATCLRFCRRPEQSAVDPLAEGEEGDAEELWVSPSGLSSDNECKSSPEFLCTSLFDFCQGLTADCSRMPAKLQQSSKMIYSNIVAPHPAGFLNCFLVVHALRAVCLHPALEAKKKSPVGRRNLPPAKAGTKRLHHRSSGSPLILTSLVPGTQELGPSVSHSPVALLSKFGGGKSLPLHAREQTCVLRDLQLLRLLCTSPRIPLCTA
ncbi:hypothetical protein NDU88_004122 [Pleurodeles waltl]|uniref:Uncharacterized protein n=1 Tax=Pleurodeles waltl TaxID=8319 RepID=A0AAV7TR04_PLEWA|nr:hypothetical protein NDU88_004122 [Pleurodeles waltl]